MRGIVGVGILSVLLAAGASGVTPEEKSAQKQWKAVTKGQLRSLKSSVKGALSDYGSALDAFCDQLASGAILADEAGDEAALMLQTVYGDVAEAVENVALAMDEAGSALLAGLPGAPSTLENFIAGDGGTLDRTIASMQKEMGKFDRKMAKSTKRIRACAASAGVGDIRLGVTLLPMPLAFRPQPSGQGMPGLDGEVPTQFLYAVGECSPVNATQFVGVLSALPMPITAWYVQGFTVANFFPDLVYKKVRTHVTIANVAAPAAMGFVSDPLGDGSQLGGGIPVGCRSDFSP